VYHMKSWSLRARSRHMHRRNREKMHRLPLRVTEYLCMDPCGVDLRIKR